MPNSRRRGHVIVMGVDPGLTHSGVCGFDGKRAITPIVEENVRLARLLRECGPDVHVCCERLACYGMAVGRSVLETCEWVGEFRGVCRFVGIPWATLYRREVKQHLCNGDPRAKDANVRQALIDRFGPDRKTAIGTKKQPGPLYGVKTHAWAALAVAVTYWDREVANA